MKVYPIALTPSIRKGGKTVFTLPTSKVSQIEDYKEFVADEKKWEWLNRM